MATLTSQDPRPSQPRDDGPSREANAAGPATTGATGTLTRSSTITALTPLTAPLSSQPQQRSISSSGAVIPSPEDLPTVFPAPIANLVTTLAMSARLSLRVTAFFIEAILETSQYSTRVSLGYTRRLLITAISSARRVYLASNAAMDGDILAAIGLGTSDKFSASTSTDAFLGVLDRWTNLGIYVIHHTFTMAELFAMSGFYLTANTVNSATLAAHESVTLFDSLFGSNETSRALASIITLVRKELLEDERFQAADRGKVACLTALTRALTAFACLQNATWNGSSQRIKLNVLYDCTIVTSNDESFSTKHGTETIEERIAGPGPSNVSARQPPKQLTDADGDVDMSVTVSVSEPHTPISASTSPTAPRPPHPSRQNSSSHVPTRSPDLELLWKLEELVGESGDDQLDASETTPDGRRQRLLKRVRDDMYEITDELSESTVVTQTLERVATGGTYRERARLTAPGVEVVVEPVEDNGPSNAATATTATSVCDPDEEDWIEVDQLLDEESNGSPSGEASSGSHSTPSDSSEKIQLVLRTMTNKLLQRKRTVRRIQGAGGFGVTISRTSPSPPPERLRSRSSTPVADRDRQAIEYGVAGPSRGTARQHTPPPTEESPSKGKGRKRQPPLPEGRRGASARAAVVGAAGNALRSAFSSGKSTPPRRSTLSRNVSNEPESPTQDSPRCPPPTPYTPAPSAPMSSLPVAKPTTKFPSGSSAYSPPSQSAPYSPPSRRGGRTVSVSESVRTRSKRLHTSSSQIFSPATEAADSLFPHEGLIKNIHRFCRYASAAYGQNFLRILGLGDADMVFPNTGRHHANSWAFAQHTRIPIESLLLSSYTETSPTISSDKAPPLVHYIAVEHHLKAIVLTCRGTLGLSDVLVDLTCDYTDITVDGGDPQAAYFVHSGMYQSALKLTEKCSRVHQTLVEALEKYPDYGLVLCGHSLGGGVAALLAITCSTKADVFRVQNSARSRPVSHPNISTPFVTSFDSGLPPGRPIHCYAYGVPAVASIDLAKYATGLISSVVQNADVVPTLSLGVLRDLKNIAVTLYEESGVAEEIVGRVVGLYKKKFTSSEPTELGAPSEEQMLADWMTSLVKTMRADMDNDKLFPPGVVYIMEYFDVMLTDQTMMVGNGAATSNKQAQRVILRQCESVEERFREPLFSKTMLNDHLPSHYERSTHLLYEGLGQGLL